MYALSRISGPATPLAGQFVMATRPRAESDRLRTRLVQLGAQVIDHPVIRIEPPDDWGPVDQALDRLTQYDWLVFSSANGVRSLLERAAARPGNSQPLAAMRIAAIGPGTADELARYGLSAALVPDQFRAESLAEALARVGGTRFLLARASRGREVLADQLAAAGATVEQVVVYASRDVPAADPAVAAELAAGRIDWITVTSSAIARALVRLFGPDLRRSRLATISPITSATLKELGYERAAEAETYTMDGLIEAIVAAPREPGKSGPISAP